MAPGHDVYIPGYPLPQRLALGPIRPVMGAPIVLVSSLGLMGGSLAAALRQAGWPVLLHHRRPEVAAEAAKRGFGEAVPDLESGLARADLAVICTPVPVVVELVRRCAAAPGHAVITDVGSVKGSICAELADLMSTGRFVGSHPMCGSHQSGLDAARADLYQNAVTICTPSSQTPPAAVSAIEALWQAVGSRVVRLDPAQHDAAMVAASHLPHVMASATAAQLTDAAAPLIAGGFRDTTRVAQGCEALWSGILLANRHEVAKGITRAREHLAELEQALAANDTAAVTAWLAAGVAGRKRAINPL